MSQTPLDMVGARPGRGKLSCLGSIDGGGVTRFARRVEEKMPHRVGIPGRADSLEVNT